MSADAFEAHFNEDKSEPVKTPENTEGQAGQPRDESGRFAPKAAESAPQPETTPAPVAETLPTPAPVAQPEPAKAEPGHVPINALLDEREKRQRLERELSELRAQQQPQNIPSVNDPEFAEYQRQLLNQTAINTRFDTSELVARQQHGNDAVQKAMDWAMERSQTSAAFAAEYLKQKHPIDWAVRQQKRHALLDEIGDDPEAYKAKLLADFQAANPAPQAQQPAASPQPAAPKPTPKPSLASAPTAGGIQTAPAKSAFEATFQG